MRERGGMLHFAPRLPAALDRVAFRLRIRGRVLQVTVHGDRATYALLAGERIEITHFGERLELSVATEQTGPLTAAEPTDVVDHPAGRRPHQRSVALEAAA